MTRINVGYWTGDDGTVWSNGIFCDLFAVDKRKNISYLCPVYILDGYWTYASNTFSTSETTHSKWR
jgi:hypothetical protein